MKIILLISLLIGLSVAQNRWDPRCPANNGSNSSPVRLAHPTDCTRFLVCHMGNAVETRCPSGQHWSVTSSSCESPERARCTYPNQRPVPGPFPPNFPQQPGFPQQPVFPQQPGFPQQPNIPQRPIMPNPRPEIEHPDYLSCPRFDVPGLPVVYFPYHLNCSHFYQCINGRAVL